jgi:hypothetical protein
MNEIIEKKSRFIGYAARAENEDEAKAFIAKIAAKHPKARHVAFAYVLPSTARTNDDGEPRGTAGLPIYNVITRRNMQSIVVVVVRYFGGTLLFLQSQSVGLGGLVHSAPISLLWVLTLTAWAVGLIAMQTYILVKWRGTSGIKWPLIALVLPIVGAAIYLAKEN